MSEKVSGGGPMLYRPRGEVSSTSRARRAGWNLADQLLSAATNVVVAFIVARNVSAADFGSFAVAFLLFTLLLGVSRALVGVPWGILHGSTAESDRRMVVGSGLGATLAIALPSSIALAIAATVLSRSDQSTGLAASLAVLAIALPFLMVQDTARLAFFAWAQPQRATLIDALWAVGQVGLIAVALATTTPSAPLMVAAWGTAAALSAALGVRLLHAPPRLRLARTWFREVGILGRTLLAEYVVRTGAFSGATLLIGAVLGLSDIGALRAAQILLGPLTVLTSAAVSFGIPEVARHGQPPARPLRFACVISSLATALSLVYVSVLLLTPDDVGQALLGDTWLGAQQLLLPVALTSTAAAMLLGPAIVLYGLGHTHRTVRLVGVLAALGVALMIVGAIVSGIVGMAWGMAVAHFAIAPLWFLALRGGAQSLEPRNAKPLGDR